MATKKSTATTDDAEVQGQDEPEAVEPPAEDAPAQDEHPRPWRVEPFSTTDGWGYRLAAADGTVVHESEAQYDSANEAVDTARNDERAEGASFPWRA